MSEEVGELARVIHKGTLASETGEIKGTIDEELWDVIYYALAIANCYDIDVEDVICKKEELNRIKYGNSVVFEVNR